MEKMIKNLKKYGVGGDNIEKLCHPVTSKTKDVGHNILTDNICRPLKQ